MGLPRLSLSAALIALFAAGASAQTVGGYVNGQPLDRVMRPAGQSGAYLAARHAAIVGNVDRAGRFFSRALAYDPDNREIMEQTVLYQTAAGRVKEALPAAQRLLKISPGDRTANLVLAVEDLAEGRFDEAKAQLAAGKTTIHPLLNALLVGWAAEGMGASDLSALDAIGDRAIFRLFGGYHRALMRSAVDDDAGAIAAFEEAMKDLTTPTGRMALAFGGALHRLGDDERAREIYIASIGASIGDAVIEDALAALDENRPAPLLVANAQEGAAEALYGLATAFSQEGEWRRGLLYARLALHLRPDFDDAALLSAEILDAQKQHRLAVNAYEGIAVDSLLSRSAEIGRAEALHKLDHTDQAEEALKALIRRQPDAIDAQLAMGDLMRRTQQFVEGAAAYDAAIKLMEAEGRENWVLYYERGICYERSDQWALAEADFLKALELRPNQPLVLNYLGYSWLDKGLKIEEAVDLIRTAVDQRPDDGYIVDSLGWAYYLMEDFDGAVEELEKAVELRPIDPVINDHLGDALWRVGRKREAEFQWRRAQSFDPDEKDLKRINRKLKVGLDVVLREEAEAATEDDAAAPVEAEGDASSDGG